MTGETSFEPGVALILGQNAGKVLALVKAGFFDMKKGSITVHFDDAGTIRKVERNTIFTFT